MKQIIKKQYRWKSLPLNMQPNGFLFTSFKWYKYKGQLEMCRSGFHCSKNIIDAMSYVDCGWLAKVEVKGKQLVQEDKECWGEMKIVKRWKWTKPMSIRLAIYAAELVLRDFEKEYPDDKRPRSAIEAAKKVLKADTRKNKLAAYAAAESAAKAAYAAAYAAYAANATYATYAAKQNILKRCHNYIIRKLINKAKGPK